MIIGICEDNAQVRQEIQQEIEKQQTNVKLQIYSFESAEEMLTSKLAFDLAFLDIELSGTMSGLDLAKQLQDKLPDLILVFVSGYTQYISSAFHLRAFQFLLKPLDSQLFSEEFARCVAQYQTAHDMFCIMVNREKISVEMKDIMYLESNCRKIKIYLKNKKVYEMYGKISEQEERLSAYHFICIHKSFLVNCRYIRKMQNEMAWIGANGDKELLMLPVSRRCKDEAQKQYHHYVMRGGM